MNTLFKLTNFPLGSITQVYIGKVTGCTCGCAGHYIHTKEHSDNRFEKDGIRLHHDDEQVKRIIEEMSTQELLVGAWINELQFRTKGEKGYILFIDTTKL